ncbi:MAG: ISL3 family transposase [Phycisphaerae bacterium]
MNLAPVLPDASSLAVEQLTLTPTRITLVVATTQKASICPVCRQPSSRIHSHYSRRLADLPWMGTPVGIELHVRRLFCDSPDCQRRIFTERLPAVTASYARKTSRLNAALSILALALGGEHASRVAEKIAIATSPDTLLRLIRRMPMPDARVAPVVGVDDWALRKGLRYGTILCDLEKHRVLDLLPEHTAESVSAWLARHPEIRTVSRDRGSTLIRATGTGAPQARQVADRFHLLKNLHEALIRCLDRQGKELQEGAKQAAAANLPATSQSPNWDPLPARPRRLPASNAERESSENTRTRREARYHEVWVLHRQGLSQRDIARRLGLDRSTVGRHLRVEDCPERAKRHNIRSTDLFLDYLRQRWSEGCHNARQLAREITARGFRGSSCAVKRTVAPWRAELPVKDPQKEPRSWQKKLVRASARHVSWLLVKTPNDLSAEEKQLVTAILEQSPTIKAATQLVLEFQQLIHGRNRKGLDAWLKKACEPGASPELKGFAESLKQDLPAVEAAFESSWSTGQVEGQINRLKLIKRQMYGRANFDLLRKRVLLDS